MVKMTIKTIVSPFHFERVFYLSRQALFAQTLYSKTFKLNSKLPEQHLVQVSANSIKQMETSAKIILLVLMYGLPVCLAIFYRINKNIKHRHRNLKIHSPYKK